MKIIIKTNAPRLHSLLDCEIPDGVKIVSHPPMERKGINIEVSVDIKLVIDLSKIAVPIVSAWLFNRCILQKGNHEININGKQTSIDQAKTEEELQKAINDEKQEYKQ